MNANGEANEKGESIGGQTEKSESDNTLGLHTEFDNTNYQKAHMWAAE